MTYGSLFSGIGGLDLALEAFGHTPVWQAESDPYARAVLAKHWPEVRRYNDVREIDHEAPPADIICGGFPCQDISSAGSRAGIDGARSGLWAEYARIVRELRPRAVFVENVSDLAVRGLDRVLGDLAAIGFDAEWTCVRASDVGAPHRRERIFILAYPAGEGWRCTAVSPVDAARNGALRTGEEEPRRRGCSVADAERDGLQGAELAERRKGADVVGRRSTHAGSTSLADPVRGGQRAGEWDIRSGQPNVDGRGEVESMAYADGAGRGRERVGWIFDGERSASGNDADRRHRAHRFPPGPATIAGWDGPQPAIRRGDDGVPGRSHRLRLLGNSVVWQQAAFALETLTARARRAASTEAA